LTLADYEATDIVSVWPEFVDAVKVFFSMQTQWRIGLSGATGLDYSALDAVYKGLGISSSQVLDVFPQLQVIESTYLKVLKENKPAK